MNVAVRGPAGALGRGPAGSRRRAARPFEYGRRAPTASLRIGEPPRSRATGPQGPFVQAINCPPKRVRSTTTPPARRARPASPSTTEARRRRAGESDLLRSSAWVRLRPHCVRRARCASEGESTTETVGVHIDGIRRGGWSRSIGTRCSPPRPPAETAALRHHPTLPYLYWHPHRSNHRSQRRE